MRMKQKLDNFMALYEYDLAATRLHAQFSFILGDWVDKKQKKLVEKWRKKKLKELGLTGNGAYEEYMRQLKEDLNR
jgi:hypothetical protein